MVLIVIDVSLSLRQVLFPFEKKTIALPYKCVPCITGHTCIVISGEILLFQRLKA